MALYTMTLSQYVDGGGQLPPSFKDIPAIPTEVYDPDNPDTIIVSDVSFSEMFFDRFCEREIGFETPALFFKRLNAAAIIKVPEYVRKIELYEGLENTFDAKRVETIHRVGHAEGAAKTENFVGAFNNLLGAATPANKNNEVSGNNSEDNETTDTHTIEGRTEAEYIDITERLLKVRNIYERLLDEFEPFFMGIF